MTGFGLRARGDAASQRRAPARPGQASAPAPDLSPPTVGPRAPPRAGAGRQGPCPAVERRAFAGGDGPFGTAWTASAAYADQGIRRGALRLVGWRSTQTAGGVDRQSPTSTRRRPPTAPWSLKNPGQGWGELRTARRPPITTWDSGRVAQPTPPLGGRVRDAPGGVSPGGVSVVRWKAPGEPVAAGAANSWRRRRLVRPPTPVSRSGAPAAISGVVRRSRPQARQGRSCRIARERRLKADGSRRRRLVRGRWRRVGIGPILSWTVLHSVVPLRCAPSVMDRLPLTISLRRSVSFEAFLPSRRPEMSVTSLPGTGRPDRPPPIAGDRPCAHVARELEANLPTMEMPGNRGLRRKPGRHRGGVPERTSCLAAASCEHHGQGRSQGGIGLWPNPSSRRGSAAGLHRRARLMTRAATQIAESLSLLDPTARRAFCAMRSRPRGLGHAPRHALRLLGADPVPRAESWNASARLLRMVPPSDRARSGVAQVRYGQERGRHQLRS